MFAFSLLEQTQVLIISDALFLFPLRGRYGVTTAKTLATWTSNNSKITERASGFSHLNIPFSHTLKWHHVVQRSGVSLHQSAWINRLNKFQRSGLYIKTSCLCLWATSSKSIHPPIHSYSPHYSFLLHIQTAGNKLINCSGLLFSLLQNFNWFLWLANPGRLVLLAFSLLGRQDENSEGPLRPHTSLTTCGFDVRLKESSVKPSVCNFLSSLKHKAKELP